MKVIDTRQVYDGSKNLINDLYEARIGTQLTQLSRADLENHLVARAVLELKTYHLPPLFDVPIRVRNAVALKSEVDLFAEGREIVTNRHECPCCSRLQHLYGIDPSYCLDCWDKLLAELWALCPIKHKNAQIIINCPEHAPEHLRHLWGETAWQRATGGTSSQFRSEARRLLRGMPVVAREHVTGWTSPKKSLLACEVGCRKCGRIADWRQLGWLWSADMADWGHGCCPSCIEFPCEAGTVWGMNQDEYRRWQDLYSTVRRLHRTVERYGAVALLLVNPSPHWANYVMKVLPHAGGAKYGTDIGRPIGKIGNPRSRARSLADLGLNVNDILCKPETALTCPDCHAEIVDGKCKEFNHLA